MGLFDKIQRKIEDKHAAARQPRPENVWEISDRTEFLIAMSERLCAKCGEGERLSALSPEERTAYAVDAFQREVSNAASSNICAIPAARWRESCSTRCVLWARRFIARRWPRFPPHGPRTRRSEGNCGTKC